jgi:hypothetical protein
VTDKPRKIWGDRYWYDENNRLHRLNGPAVIFPLDQKEWWVYGKRHRLDGPAIERVVNGINCHIWYVNGVNISKEVEEWLAMTGYEYPFSKDVQVEFKLKWYSDV